MMLKTIQAGVLLLLLAPCVGSRIAFAAKPDARLPEAARRGDQDAVRKLLAEKVDVNSAEGDGCTALHWAAYEDDLGVARILLRARANEDAKTRIGGITPLFMAAQNGSAPMIQALLAAGARANEVDGLGTTVLMIAAASGSVDAVSALLRHGADPNAKEGAHGQTALMFAAALDRADVVKVLRSYGADPNAETAVTKVVGYRMGRDGNLIDPDAPGPKKADEDEERQPADPAKDAKAEESEQVAAAAIVSKETAAFDHGNGPSGPKFAPSATANADPKKARRKPREYGAATMGGMTPLLFAARQGNLAAADALLDGGADVNEASGSEKASPLVMAISNGHFDLAKLLIERGADVNLGNVMGLEPLYATIDVQWAPHEWSPEPIVAQEKTNYLDLMKLILARGGQVNARLGKKVWSRVMTQDMSWTDPAGATAFWRAAQADDLAAMRLLVEAGADPKLSSKIGATPLMVAAGLGWAPNYNVNAPGPWLPAVQYCVQLGDLVTAKDELGETALHGAAFVGRDEIVQYLVDKGAKTDVKTEAGDTVADMANGPFAHAIPHLETVALLERLGSPNSHNCRSDQCVVAPKEDKRPAAAPAPTAPATAAKKEPAWKATK